MGRDYARGRKPAGAAGSARRSRRPGGRDAPPARSGSGGRWYFAGLLSGLFIAFLGYLGTLPGEPGPAPEAAAQEPATPPPEAPEPPRPRFEFYTLLPAQTLEPDLEPAEVAPPVPRAGGEQYLLQAGSFRQRQDAESRRAELLLLNLDPRIEETAGDNGRWFRVYLGPFDSHEKMARARGLTTAQNIDTLLLRREGP